MVARITFICILACFALCAYASLSPCDSLIKFNKVSSDYAATLGTLEENDEEEVLVTTNTLMRAIDDDVIRDSGDYTWVVR